jgi:hypothetical protein
MSAGCQQVSAVFRLISRGAVHAGRGWALVKSTALGGQMGGDAAVGPVCAVPCVRSMRELHSIIIWDFLPLQMQSWLYIIPVDVYDLLRTSVISVLRALQTVLKFFFQVSEL